MGIAEPEPLPPGFRLDRYEIQAELAPAIVGRRYRALDTHLKEVVAVTVLGPTLRNGEGLIRIRRAFRIARSKHPRDIHDYGESGGIPFVVGTYNQADDTAMDISPYLEAAQQ
jgi:hypothetical protein